MTDQNDTPERYYEFEQRETFSRPFYVRASSLKEARQIVRSGGGAADFSPNFPDLEIRGRGRICRDQEHAKGVEDMRQAEDEGAPGWGR